MISQERSLHQAVSSQQAQAMENLHRNQGASAASSVAFSSSQDIWTAFSPTFLGIGPGCRQKVNGVGPEGGLPERRHPRDWNLSWLERPGRGGGPRFPRPLLPGQVHRHRQRENHLRLPRRAQGRDSW